MKSDQSASRGAKVHFEQRRAPEDGGCYHTGLGDEEVASSWLHDKVPTVLTGLHEALEHDDGFLPSKTFLRRHAPRETVALRR